MNKNILTGLALALLSWGCSTGTLAPDKKVGTRNPVSPERLFTNPVANGADPWVIKKDGIYYSCSAGGGGIQVSKSAVLSKPGQKVVVWQPPASGWNHANIWAPEMHFFGGHWYIYYAAAPKPGSPFIQQRSGVLESQGADPFGPYTDKGMLYTGDDLRDPASVKWAIDLSPFRMNGQLYAMWSGWEQNADTDKTKQHLYIARMSNPWTISSNRVKISSPLESWETGGPLDLNEGPQMLKKKASAFIIYSCRESWLKEYRLGQLRLSDTLRNPLDPANWEKSGPVFQGTEQVFGVGHCSFTTSPDGSEDWIVYHAKKSTTPGWQRDIRMQRFSWKANGAPDFGVPVPAGVPLQVPAGEKSGSF